MNYWAILYILGWIFNLEAIFMLIPCGIGLVNRESNAVWFFVVATISFLIGFLLTRKKPKNPAFYAKESFVAVSLSWIVLSIMGCLPFCLSGTIPSFTDALFETISGFTTTGASILSEPHTLTYGMQFWRCFTHWVGGMGVLVFMLAVLPSTGGQNLFLMKAESPGPSVGKLVPKIQQTAKYLYVIYFVLTMIQLIALVIAGMPFFDAVCTAMSTAGTGGFGIKPDSLGSYSVAIQNIVTIFMFLFGVNFNFYFLILMKKVGDALKMEEVRAYLIVYICTTVFVGINLLKISADFAGNLQQAAFQTSSIMTTTGFATVDFDQWPEFSKMILLFLMFFGGCAGSTAGGIKAVRFVMYSKALKKELNRLVHPRTVKNIGMDGKAIPKDIIHSTQIYLAAYMAIFAISVLILSLNGYDFVTNFTATAATINNVGPGLSMVGPTCNYGFFSGLSKYVLMFNMLVGRLEIFPMMILLLPGTWRKN